MGSIRDPFGVVYPIKQLLINTLGYLSYWPLRVSNQLSVVGEEILRELPDSEVLFIANHQTYYMDGIALYHSIGYVNRPYLLSPRKNFYYIAAEETMRMSGWLPKLLAYTGALTVKRTWKEGERIVDREVDPLEIDKIGVALKSGWVLTFPQGTTRPYAPGRIGCAKLIKQYRPTVVPVVLSGLAEAFQRDGLLPKARGVPIGIEYKRPLEIDYLQAPETILQQVMDAIEQSDSWRPEGIHPSE